MQAELAVINNQHLATGRSFPPPSVIKLQTFEVGKGLHASCFACFDTVGCIFKHQAGGGVRGGLKALGSVQEDVWCRLAILYHVTCTPLGTTC